MPLLSFLLQPLSKSDYDDCYEIKSLINLWDILKISCNFEKLNS